MSKFPTYKAWRKAILLFLPFYCIALVVPTFMFWNFLALNVILAAYGEGYPNVAWGFTLGMLLATVIGYLLLILIYSLFLKFFWDKPPQWVKTPQSWKVNLFNLSVGIVATLPLSIINLLYLITIGSIEQMTQTDIKAIYIPKLLWQLSWVWLIGAAYLYQWQSDRQANDPDEKVREFAKAKLEELNKPN